MYLNKYFTGGDRDVGENDAMDVVEEKGRVVTKTRPNPQPTWVSHEDSDDESDLTDVSDSGSDTEVDSDDSDSDDDEPLLSRKNANIAYNSLKAFISLWKQRKKISNVVTKAPRNIPDGKDRDATLDWILGQVESAKNVKWDINTVVELYLYVTNQPSDMDLSSVGVDIVLLLNTKVSEIYRGLSEPMSKDDFRHSIVEGIKQRVGVGLGDPTTSVIEYIDSLLPHDLIGSLQIDSYNVYCVTMNGVPHLILDNDNRFAFSVNDRFNRTYEHYKRNPSYKYADITLTFHDPVTWKELKTIITFVLDGSSDTDVSRLFWKGSRSKTLAIPARDVIAMATDSMSIPDKLTQFMKLMKMSGEISYLIKGVGALDEDKDWAMYELYKEVVTAQEKLWKQASENRSLMDKSLQQLEEMGRSDGFHITVSNNKKIGWEERKDKKYVNMCSSNVNPQYERDLYRNFIEGKEPLVLFEAWAMDGSSKEPLAMLFASDKTEETQVSEAHVELFCKNQRVKVTRAARFIFPYAIKYLSQEYDYISLEAVPLAVPFYETYGFIRGQNRDDWILPVQKGKRKFTRTTFDPAQLRKRPKLPDCKPGETFNVLTGRCSKLLT